MRVGIGRDRRARSQGFLAAKGAPRPDGQLDDPPLADFEAQIRKYVAVQEEVQVRARARCARGRPASRAPGD